MQAIFDRLAAARLRAWTVAGLAAMILAATIPADAARAAQASSSQKPIRRGSFEDPYYGTQNGQICRRWCVEDRQPCDPVQFKLADGRCAYGRDWFGQ